MTSQAERRNDRRQVTKLRGVAKQIERTIAWLEKLTKHPLERRAYMPTERGGCIYYIVGAKVEEDWAARKVTATEENNAWLEENEQCPDCGHRLRGFHPEEDDIVCDWCHACYTRKTEHRRKALAGHLCEGCGLPQECDDGGPNLCFGCRASESIATVCSGCGALHTPRETPPSVRATSYGNNSHRLCGSCREPVDAHRARHRASAEATAAFRTLCERFESYPQACEALRTSTWRDVEHLPLREPETWTTDEVERAHGALKEILRNAETSSETDQHDEPHPGKNAGAGATTPANGDGQT